MKFVKELFGEYKFLIILFVCILFFLIIIIPSIVNFLFKFPAANEFFVAEWDAENMLSYIGTVFTFMGSSIISLLALHQNKIINDYSKEHDKLINEIETMKVQPLFSVKGVSVGTDFFTIRIENISDNIAHNLVASDFSFILDISDKCCKSSLAKDEFFEINLKNSKLKMNEPFHFNLSYSDCLGKNRTIIFEGYSSKDKPSTFLFQKKEV